MSNNYITTQAVQLYNTTGNPMEKWPEGKPFVSDGEIKQIKPTIAMMNLAPYTKNRWIPVGSYKLVDVIPPPVDPPPPVNIPVGAISQTRYSFDGMITWTPWEYWEKIDV